MKCVVLIARFCLPYEYDYVSGEFNKKLSYRLETGRQKCISFFVAKLLSIAVKTYSYDYRLRSLRPMIRLIYYAHSE